MKSMSTHYEKYGKAYRQSEKGRERALLRWQSRQDLLLAFKANGCIRCGEKDPVCIDAHHVEPSNKSFTLVRKNADRSEKSWIAELDKCVPLCANCHRKEHNGAQSV